MWDVSAANCTFTGNKAASAEAGNGGGMLVYTEATANVVNCTFAGNAASYRGHEVYLGAGGTLNAANTIFWNADAAKPAVYNDNAALRLYNCAYGSGTFTDGDGSCITGLDWSGRASVKQTVNGVEHTVFMLESGKDGDLINGGLDASDVKAKLGLAVEPELTKDQLGSARGDEPSIGAVEPVDN